MSCFVITVRILIFLAFNLGTAEYLINKTSTVWDKITDGN